MRLNNVIYQTPDFDRGSTFSRIVREYLDFQPFLAIQRETYKQRILNAESRHHPQTIEEADGYIDAPLKQTWTRVIGFRNILVHDYLQVDRTIVHSVLKDDLDDFERLRRVFAQFL